MKPHAQTHGGFANSSISVISPPRNTCPCAPSLPRSRNLFSTVKRRRISLSATCRQNSSEHAEGLVHPARASRRGFLITPFLAAAGAYALQSAVKARAEEEPVEKEAQAVDSATEVKDELVTSRIYDATVVGEPLALGKEKGKVWEKLMNARIVYLGEAEQVPTADDKELELEIVKNLQRRCLESERPLSLAMEAFPCDLQEQLNQFMDKRIDGETLKSYTSYWPPDWWLQYEPLLLFCRDNGIRLIACGVPLKVLRTVRAEGVSGLSKADRKAYTPPAGSGFISGFTFTRRSPIDVNSLNQTVPFGPSSYLAAQSRVVEEFTMSQIILQEISDRDVTGMLVVITGAGHIAYGSRGMGVPARISKKMQKKNQVVILLDPEKQYIRREGEAPLADFLWYSAKRPCSRNCFDRAEIARVMNAAGRRHDALPQDLQNGLDRGIVPPEVLQNFFDLEQYPLLSELAHRFQGFRERLLADPKFLNRLAIEEAISVTTTLIAQYEKRKENFIEELDYVITDTVRGIVVDFFTVWLPAPTLSFLSYADETSVPDSMGVLKDLLGSIPDNAFQKNLAGKDWNFTHRVASVLVGGLKLASVGFISSIGAVAASNILYVIRRHLSPSTFTLHRNKRSPLLKTALVYASFLGTSANLRYQVIAGIVEHRISDAFSSQVLLVNMLSFVARTINSYWGTQQWVDLARFTGLQAQKSKPSYEEQDISSSAILGNSKADETTTDEITTDEINN